MATSASNLRMLANKEPDNAIRRPLQSLNVNFKPRVDSNSSLGDKDKALKPKAVLNFVASVDVAPSSSAEMTVNKEMKRSESQTYEEQIKAIFRERSSFYAESRDAIEPEEDNDLWTLKRASPLADEEDEEYTSYESPSKKSKSENLFWDTRLSDSDLFDIAAMMTSR